MGSFADAVGLMGSVLFHKPGGRAPSELTCGGMSFGHYSIRRHVEAKHRPTSPAVPSRHSSEASEAEVVMAGTLEQKLARGDGQNERSDGGGWRVRRFVLHSGSVEWTVGEPGSDGELHVLLLHPVISVVRASGDGSRPEENARCVSVAGMLDGASDVLVLRAADEDERDAWLRAMCTCIERLKALAFDAAVDAAARRLTTAAEEHGEAAAQREGTREGVRLLMERFFRPSALEHGSTATALSGSSGAAASSDDVHIDLARSLAASLLTRQAEARVRAGIRAEPSGRGEDETRGLQLFPWQPAVAGALEEVTWRAVSAWRDQGPVLSSLAPAAQVLDFALGISEPFGFSSAPVSRVDPDGVARRVGADDVGPWCRFCGFVHAAFVRRVLDIAASPPAPLNLLAEALESTYATLVTCEDGGGDGALIGAAGGASCKVIKRFSSSARALLIEVSTPAKDADEASAGEASADGELAAAPAPVWIDVVDATWDATAAASVADATQPSLEGDDTGAVGADGASSATQFIFKRGDSLWQDLGTLLLLREMNVLWGEAGAPAFVQTYRVWPTGERAGFIEVLQNATPVRDAEFAYSSSLHNSAVGAFTAGLVLGLADRHQDNMLLVGPPHAQVFGHIDFGYVAGARPWFDANLLPVPERFMRCLSAAGKWADFVNDVAFAFAVLQKGRAQLCAVASVFAEPVSRAGYPAYIDRCLTSHSPESVRAMVEAAPGDLARRFKNLHHKLSHAEGG